MNKILAAKHIDFADSEYKSFQMSDNFLLTINMTSWQEKPLKLLFFHTIKFFYTLGDVTKDLYEISNDSFLNEMILKMYEHPPLNHPFKLFHLEDIYDYPFIKVIAKSVEIVNE